MGGRASSTVGQAGERATAKLSVVSRVGSASEEWPEPPSCFLVSHARAKPRAWHPDLFLHLFLSCQLSVTSYQ